MTTSTDSRTLRADAERNRQRLIKVAFRAFSSGADNVTLEAIASEAGVGIGTLYRHSTTIQSLLDAGAAAGTVRNDVTAQDVLASLTGIFLAAGAPGQREQAGRMLDLLMDGLSARAARQVTSE